MFCRREVCKIYPIFQSKRLTCTDFLTQISVLKKSVNRKNEKKNTSRSLIFVFHSQRPYIESKVVWVKKSSLCVRRKSPFCSESLPRYVVRVLNVEMFTFQ